jgi:uncharacterized protein YjbI with pentapeptide repeats
MVRHGGKNDRFWRKKRRSSTVDFTKANLTNADLSGSLLTAVSRTGDTTIDFSEANLINADLSGAGLTSASGKRVLPEDAGVSTIDFTQADLTNANLSGSTAALAGMARATLATTLASADR